MTEQVTTTTETTPAPVTTDAGFDVSALLANDDDVPAVEPVEETPKEVPVEVAKPVETAKALEVEKSVETAKPAEVAKPVEVTKPTETPIDVKALRQQTLEQLEAAAAITDEATIEGLRSEPEKYLPKLVAKAKLETYEAVTHALIQQIPAFIMAFNERMTASKDVETQFTTRWPQLKDPKFEADIINAATLHAQLNPNATLEQRIEDVGAALVVRHKLFEAPKAPIVPTPTATNTPVTPTRPGSVLSDTKGPASPFAELLAED